MTGGRLSGFFVGAMPLAWEAGPFPREMLDGSKKRKKRDALKMKRPAVILIEVFENVFHSLINAAFYADIHKPHQFLFNDGLILFLLLFVGTHGFFTSLVTWIL